jgi:methylphosphotriester-DNA--protein-cysteine methyltransferase
MQTVTNLTDDKLLKLLESFSTDWEVEFKQNVTAQEISSLNSIIHLRNGMAHGGSQSVSYRIVRAHYDNIKQIIARLKKIIAKQPKKAGKKQKVA